MKQNLISFSKGPQFRGGEAVAPFMVTMVLILFSVYLAMNGFAIFLLLTIPLLVFMVNFIMDVQGVEIDKANGLVRVYKLDRFVKYGDWQNFKHFYQISLDHETYIIKETTIYTSLTTVNPRNRVSDVKHTRLIISLVNRDPSKNIILVEKENYLEAVAICFQMSKKFGLPFENVYENRVMAENSRKR